MIATGLGLHNFSEGLAIGQAASTGAIGFAVTLIVGFGLHNVTEGFAVAAPVAAAGEVPSWSFLGVAGLIGGGPTFLGTLIGYRVTSPEAFVLFLALAAGALFYVIGEMFVVGRRFQQAPVSAWGIIIGFSRRVRDGSDPDDRGRVARAIDGSPERRIGSTSYRSPGHVVVP